MDEQKGPRSPHVWVSTTYFAEGYPYSVVHTYAEVLFKEMGASLQAIGLTSLFHLPWNIKFLWGPFLDIYGTKRKWLLGIEVAICAIIVAMAFAATATNVLLVSSILFIVLAALSATHDIAIDGYYLEGLDRDGQSKFVGYRATAYKLAMLLVGGPMLVLIGLIGWFWGFVISAAVIGLILGYHALFLPRVETPKKPFAALGRALMQVRSVGVAIGIAGFVVGLRALFRSSAYASVRGSLVEAAPFLTRISTSSWIALLLLFTLLVVLAMLPRLKRKLDDSDSSYAEAYVSFLDQKKVGAILGFIILFRAGESFLVKMRYAFLSDMGMTLEQYGLAYGTIGMIASFSGTLIGGWLIAKHGLKRWIWPMVLAQNLLNLLFMFVALYGANLADAALIAGAQDVATGTAALAQQLAGGADATLTAAIATPRIPFPVATTVITIEAFGSGLGTAVFMVYIMRCCKSAYKAGHMAILTALMSLSFLLAGVMSGFLAEALGYAMYFGFTFLATIPGMLLIFIIPYLDGDTADDAEPA